MNATARMRWSRAGSESADGLRGAGDLLPDLKRAYRRKSGEGLDPQNATFGDHAPLSIDYDSNL